MPELFIGLTTWNDAAFVRRSLPALQRTLAGVDAHIAAWDNASEDDTPAVLRELGVEPRVRRCAQADALDGLLAMSDAPYTLLLHSDVFILAPAWFSLLRDAMRDTGAALISPEDIGLGNFRRRAFRGFPESSFMFCDTAKIRACRRLRPVIAMVKNAVRFRYLSGLRGVGFDASHITHGLPDRLAACGLTWDPMTPLTSPRLDAPWSDDPAYAEESRFTYGDGNFYTYHGVITHYHNWYARYVNPHAAAGDMDDAQQAYSRAYTARFFADFDAGTLHLP
jgi:hypothetical protein